MMFSEEIIILNNFREKQNNIDDTMKRRMDMYGFLAKTIVVR